MTKLEALQSIIDFEVPVNLINKVLIDEGVDGNADYSVSDKKEIDLCLAELYFHLAAKADISEGDISIKIDRKSLLSLRDDILRKYGLLSDDGSVNDVSHLW